MLANGAKLYYAAVTTGSPSYTEIPDLKEIPDIGADPELVDNTALNDSIVHKEVGIGDSGDMEFVFRYDNEKATSSYRVAKSLDGTKKMFKVQLHDNTKFEFTATASVKVSGGGVNDPIEFVMALALQSDITITDPA